MAASVGHLDYAHDRVPPFASVRTVNGVTQLQIRVLVGKPFKRATIWGPVGFGAAVISVASLTVLLHNAPAPLSWLPMILGGVCLLGFFAGLIFLATCVAASSMRGDAVVDSQKLRLKDRGNLYEFPIEEIRSLRQVVYPGSRLEADLERPVRHLLFRGRRTALQVEVSDGQIEFFHFFEEPKVAWMAENVSRLVFANRPRATTTEPTDDRDSTARVIASKLYGKPRRMLALGGIIFGAIATLASGWYAYRGLSSLEWPSVQGQVISSHYEETHDSSKAEIKYSYKVLGSTYTNDDFGFTRSLSDDVVKELVTQHPAGSPITVYYNRSRPANSIVIVGLGPLHWLIVGISLVPLSIGLLLALRPTTRGQEALVTRYRVAVHPPEHMLQLPAKVRWTVSSDAWRLALYTARRQSFWMAVRVIGITALALWAADHWLARYVRLTSHGLPAAP
jgi:hypothetical protein